MLIAAHSVCFFRMIQLLIMYTRLRENEPIIRWKQCQHRDILSKIATRYHHFHRQPVIFPRDKMAHVFLPIRLYLMQFQQDHNI